VRNKIVVSHARLNNLLLLTLSLGLIDAHVGI